MALQGLGSATGQKGTGADTRSARANECVPRVVRRKKGVGTSRLPPRAAMTGLPEGDVVKVVAWSSRLADLEGPVVDPVIKLLQNMNGCLV